MSDNTPVYPPFHFKEGEVLLIDKPLGWTSFDVVSKIRNSLKPEKIKVGHAGTLDPLASGLLMLCTGKKTKTIDTLQALQKEYTGTFTLGATTPTYDLESHAEANFSLEGITHELLRQTAVQFTGELEQLPPAHSAVKVNGERLYEKARRGEAVERKPRNVHIYEFELTRIALPEVDFRVVCSKGTYIRSLASDFGKALSNGAYLSALRRTKNGDYNVRDAYELQSFIEHLQRLKQDKATDN